MAIERTNLGCGCSGTWEAGKRRQAGMNAGNTNLDKMIDNDPFSFLTSPKIGPIRYVNPAAFATSNFLDSMQFIFGDDEARKNAADGFKQRERIAFPFLQIFG